MFELWFGAICMEMLKTTLQNSTNLGALTKQKIKNKMFTDIYIVLNILKLDNSFNNDTFIWDRHHIPTTNHF